MTPTKQKDRRGGKFRYLYRVTYSNHPQVEVGKLLIDKGRLRRRDWEFLDLDTGSTWQVVGVRLNRLCVDCHDQHRRATQIGHPGECGPDVPPVVPQDREGRAS